MSAPILVGKTLGAYRVMSLIGEGGMGQVYRARDERLGRDVALKTVLGEAAGDSTWPSRFEREARAIAALNHPNILTIFDVGIADGIAYFVAELLDGQSLRDLLQSKRLSVAQAIQLSAQIAAGLAAAHARGVVHRDVKPGNIQVTAAGRAKILDFGLARVMPGPVGASGAASSETQEMTAHGAVLGTVAYMAPEQARGQAVDARADIFAFGVLLYEMVSGRSPFKRDNTADTLAAVLSHTPSPLLTTDPADAETGVPRALARLVTRCLAKDPADRWQSTADLAAELQWMADTISAPVPVPLPGAPKRASASHASSARRLTLTGVGLLAATGLGLSLGVSWPRDGVPPPVERLRYVLPEGSTLRSRPAVSPDGTLIAFTASLGDAASELFLKTMTSADAQLVPNARTARWPAFSPDGGSIAFLAGRRLKIVTIATGDVLDVCEVATGAAYVDWTSAGEIVFSFNLEPDSAVMSVRVPPDGTGPRRAVTAVSGQQHSVFAPQRLSGGALLYSARAATSTTLSVLVRPTENADSRVLVEGTSARLVGDDWLLYQRDSRLFADGFDTRALRPAGQPVQVAADLMPSNLARSGSTDWSASASTIVYRVNDRPVRRLVWQTAGAATTDQAAIPLKGGSPESVQFFGRDDRLAIKYRDRGNYEHLDLRSGVETSLTAYDATSVLWMPDGDSALVLSSREGRFGIYRQPVGQVARGAAILEDEHRNKHFGAVTPDGGQVVFSQDNGAANLGDILLAPVREGARATALVATAADERWPLLSADGRWLSYLVTQEAGDPVLYVAPFPAGKPAVPVARGALEPRWSRSTTRAEIFFRKGGQMQAVLLDSDGRPGLPRTLFDRAFIPSTNNYDVSSDGRFLLLDELPVSRSSFFMILRGWRGLAGAK